jgi:hypothetical protein
MMTCGMPSLTTPKARTRDTLAAGRSSMKQTVRTAS